MKKKRFKPEIDFWTWLSLRSSALPFSFELNADAFPANAPQVFGPNERRVAMLFSASQVSVFSVMFGVGLPNGNGLVFWPVTFPAPNQNASPPLIVTARDVGTTITMPIFAIAAAAGTFLNGFEVSADVSWIDLYRAWYGDLVMTKPPAGKQRKTASRPLASRQVKLQRGGESERYVF